mmetsp:Transcript_5914/g.13380  ORF Transcript_5914/g.13380 Transcript_5914/m.13380 type:complete len:240 (+) Transcript_5914:245-964(+)
MAARMCRHVANQVSRRRPERAEAARGGIRRVPRTHTLGRTVAVRVRRRRLGIRGRYLHRPATRPALRFRGDESESRRAVPAWREDYLPCHHRTVRRQRRRKLTRNRQTQRRRNALRPERREEVDHERNVRGLLHGGCSHGKAGLCAQGHQLPAHREEHARRVDEADALQRRLGVRNGVCDIRGRQGSRRQPHWQAGRGVQVHHVQLQPRALGIRGAGEPFRSRLLGGERQVRDEAPHVW